MLLLSRCATSAVTSQFFFVYVLKYNLSHNFKMVFTIFSPINVAHYLFIYFHYHLIINPVHYLFIYFHYHPIINLYNQSSQPLIYLVPQLSPTQILFSSALGFCVSLFSLKNQNKIYILLKAEAQRLMLLLSRYVISAATSFFFFFSFLKYNLSYNFKMVFTIFSPINTAHFLFIYFHYHPIIHPTHYLFIYFHYHPIINLYN